VGNTKPGTRSTLTVFRRGTTKDLMVTIGELEPEKSARAKTDREEKPKATGAVTAFGLTVSDLTDAQKRELKVKGGVRVEAAADAAARAGLREGDVIVSVANLEINSVKELEALLAKIDKTKPLSLLFRRGDWAQYIVIKPSSR
jgi:serine protease Do